MFLNLIITYHIVQAIVPKKGQTKAPRLRAMDRDYHLECFKWVQHFDENFDGNFAPDNNSYI